MPDSNVIDSILRLHDKIDNLREDVSEIKISQANLPCGSKETRLRIIERIVYGAVAIVLIGFMVSIASNSPNKAIADKSAIMRDIKR